MGSEKGQKKFFFILTLIVIGLFFLSGLFLLFSDYFKNLPQNVRIIFAFLIISFGAFRLVTVINKKKNEDEE